MGLDREHLADPLQGLLGLALLEKTDDGVDAHHPENDAGVHPVAEHGGNEPGGEQDVDEQVMEMFEEPLEETFPGRRRQAVRADIFQSAFGLVSGQSGGRGGQLGEDGLGRQAVERSAGQAGGCFLVHELWRSLSQGGVVGCGRGAAGARSRAGLASKGTVETAFQQPLNGNMTASSCSPRQGLSAYRGCGDVATRKLTERRRCRARSGCRTARSHAASRTSRAAPSDPSAASEVRGCGG